jgi:hypothetical protein
MKIGNLIRCGWTALFLGASIQAQLVLIDDFDTPSPTLQFNPPPLSSGGGPVSQENGPLAGVVGGYRDIALYNVSNTSSCANRWARANTGAQTFSLSNDNSVNSTARLVWDGNDSDGFGVAPNGLGGMDMTTGGAVGIGVGIVALDLNTTLTFTVYYGGGLSSMTAAHTFTSSGSVYVFRFTEFGNPAGFTDVGAVVLEMTGPTSFDTEFDYITGVVPEPSCLGVTALLLGAFGAARLIRSRAGNKSRHVA